MCFVVCILFIYYSLARAAAGNPAYLWGECLLLKLHDLPVEIPLWVCPVEMLYVLGDGPLDSAIQQKMPHILQMKFLLFGSFLLGVMEYDGTRSFVLSTSA